MLGLEALGHLARVRQLVVGGARRRRSRCENVVMRPPVTSRMLATTTLESTPPDRNAPSGTSLSRRSRTASRISARMRLAQLSRVQPGRRRRRRRQRPVAPRGQRARLEEARCGRAAAWRCRQRPSARPALHHYDWGATPATRSAFAGIAKLAPGHTATFSAGVLTPRRYWALPAGTPTMFAGLDARELAEAVRGKCARPCACAWRATCRSARSCPAVSTRAWWWPACAR